MRCFLIHVFSDSCEFGSRQYFALCGLGGILSCGITHTAIVPLDLVKCRIQVNPTKYRSIVNGFRVSCRWFFPLKTKLLIWTNINLPVSLYMQCTEPKQWNLSPKLSQCRGTTCALHLGDTRFCVTGCSEGFYGWFCSKLAVTTTFYIDSYLKFVSIIPCLLWEEHTAEFVLC